MNTTESFELLAAYTLNELTPSEKRAVEERLETDLDLQKDLALLQELRKTQAEREHLAVLKKTIATVAETRKQASVATPVLSVVRPAEAQKNVFSRIRPLAIAASVAAIFVVGYYALKPSISQDLYAHYAKKPIEHLMSGTATVFADTPKLNEGITAFNANDFKKAKTVFEELAKSSDSPEVLVPLARCYTELDEYAHAETTIGLLEQQQNNEVLWLRACLFLRKGDFQAAKSLLQRAVDDRHLRVRLR